MPLESFKQTNLAGSGSAYNGPSTGRNSPCNQYWLLNKVITLGGPRPEAEEPEGG